MFAFQPSSSQHRKEPNEHNPDDTSTRVSIWKHQLRAWAWRARRMLGSKRGDTVVYSCNVFCEDFMNRRICLYPFSFKVVSAIRILTTRHEVQSSNNSSFWYYRRWLRFSLSIYPAAISRDRYWTVIVWEENEFSQWAFVSSTIFLMWRERSVDQLGSFHRHHKVCSYLNEARNRLLFLSTFHLEAFLRLCKKHL